MNRRRFLIALAAGSAIAGCLSDASTEGNGTSDNNSATTAATSEPTDRVTTPVERSTRISDRSATSPSETKTHTPNGPSSQTTTSEPESTTHGLLSGPDERETRTPPGSPALDPNGVWPTFRFDAANSGYNPEGTGLKQGEQYWRLAPTGAATLTDETLFAVTNGEDYRTLTRRDPATAEVRSRTRLVDYGVNPPPTVAGDRVFVTTFIEAFCLATDRNTVVWRGPEMDGIQAPPAVSDGTVFVNSGGFEATAPQLRAFDAATGNEQWRYDTGNRSYTTPAVETGRVFIASSAGLHAVDATSGEQLYFVADVGGERTVPAVANGSIYIVTHGRSEDDQLVAVDAADGSVQWRESFPDLGYGSPVIADDIVYAEGENGVVALDAASGQRSRMIGGSGSPVARVGEVLYTTDGGTLVALDVSGGQLWSHTTEEVQIQDTIGQDIHHVTPVAGAVYVSAHDGFHGFGPA